MKKTPLWIAAPRAFFYFNFFKSFPHTILPSMRLFFKRSLGGSAARPAILLFSISEDHVRMWYFFAKKHFDFKKWRLIIVDSAGVIDPAYFPDAEVFRFLNLYHGRKIDFFIKRIPSEVVLVCDDDKYFMRSIDSELSLLASSNAAEAQKIPGAFAAAMRMILKKTWQGATLLIAIAGYYALKGAYELSAATITGAAFFASYAASGLYESYYVGNGAMRRYAQGSLLISFAIAASLTGAAYFFPNNSAALVFAFFCTNACTAGVWTAVITKKSKAQGLPNDTKFLEFAKKASWTEGVLQATNYADILLVNAFFGPKDVAVYAVARIIPEAVKGLVKNAGVLSIARIATMKKSAIRRMLIARTAQAFAIAGGFFIAYVAIAPYAFNILFPTYPEALRYSELLALSFLAFPAHLAESTLNALLIKEKIVRLNIAAAGGMLIFSCILIPPFGVLGAILARVFARFSNAAVAFYLALRAI